MRCLFFRPRTLLHYGEGECVAAYQLYRAEEYRAEEYRAEELTQRSMRNSVAYTCSSFPIRYINLINYVFTALIYVFTLPNFYYAFAKHQSLDGVLASM